MPAPIVIALDAHGGDFGPPVTVPAALDALEAEPRLHLLLAGLPAALEPQLAAASPDLRARLEVVSAEHALDSAPRPVTVLRTGQDSSLGRALTQVAEGRAAACVSAGSTTAIMTLAMRQIGMLDGIRRPALMSRMPTARGMLAMLDLGANLSVSALQLQQFAVMGSVAGAEGERLPSVGLLNVGHEETKGLAVVREAHEALLRSTLDYRGFIEGHDIFAGRVDVAVCDGFTGNLVLKSSEGLAAMLFEELRRTLDGSWRARLGAALARPALAGMLERLDPAKHNGAPLLGLKQVVVKSHGRANRFATRQALLEACREVERRVPERIAKLLQSCGLESET